MTRAFSLIEQQKISALNLSQARDRIATEVNIWLLRVCWEIKVAKAFGKVLVFGTADACLYCTRLCRTNGPSP
jgi:hypothetical protein